MNGAISGRVTDAGGAPVPGATVALTSSDVAVSDIAALTDSGGNFRRSGLAAGSYTLEVRKSGQPARSIPVAVAEGEQVHLDVRLGESLNGTESHGELAVELKADLIDWSQVRLVRVALDYPGAGRSNATGKDFILTPGNHEAPTWQVPVDDSGLATYTYEIEYFLANGLRKRVRASDASERTLILDPSQ
jgi:hypothetical protein